VHFEHWFDMQMGAMGFGHCAALLSTQSTHLPVLVLQVVPMLMQASGSRVLHSPQTPPVRQAGNFGSRCAQAVSPLSSRVHVPHSCVDVLQMGLVEGQSPLSTQVTQVPDTTSHTFEAGQADASGRALHK
jgi:hypothetical protein